MTERYLELKQRQREIRDRLPEALGLRVHRALSWLQRAEGETEDEDARFIFLWIAFNAAYANELPDQAQFTERSVFVNFIERLVAFDGQKVLYHLVWETFPGPIRLLIDNRYVFQPYWDHLRGRLTAGEWEAQFERNRSAARRALSRMQTATVLSILFSRLYTLRNQLIHGGATWNSRINRRQVSDGARIMERLVPEIIAIMMDNPDALWGDPCYPVVTD